MWTGEDFEYTNETIKFQENSVPYESYILLTNEVPASYIEAHKFQLDTEARPSSFWICGRLLSNPEFRGRGYAMELMRLCFERVFKLGATHIGAYREAENNPIKNLHDRLGFVTVSQSENLRNCFFIQLEKSTYFAFKKVDQANLQRWRDSRSRLLNTTKNHEEHEIIKETHQTDDQESKLTFKTNDTEFGSIFFSKYNGSGTHVLLKDWEIQTESVLPLLKSWLNDVTFSGDTVVCSLETTNIEKRVTLTLLGFQPIRLNSNNTEITFIAKKELLTYGPYNP